MLNAVHTFVNAVHTFANAVHKVAIAVQSMPNAVCKLVLAKMNYATMYMKNKSTLTDYK